MSSSTSTSSYHTVLDLSILQDDLDEFSWLVEDHKDCDLTFEYEEQEVPKTIEPFLLTMPYTDSPPSSLSTMNEDGSNSDIEYSESDSDAEEDTFWSTHEEPYRVLGGHAYPISVLEDATRSGMNLSQLPTAEPDTPSLIFSGQTGSSRSARRKSRLPPNLDAPSDDEDESKGGSSDEEYIPSPRLNSRKRIVGRSTVSRSSSSSPDSSSSKRPRPSLLPRDPRVSRREARPRNAQVDPSTPIFPDASKRSSFKCPHCSWVQSNGRMPDLKRHILTHKGGQWVCRGVPVEHAGDYGVSPECSPIAYGEAERLFVGGCSKRFSRRDALKRHLDNANITCKGDIHAMLDWDC